MPVVARPPRGPRGPSGFEKFLQAAGTLSGVANTAANLITLPRRLDQMDQQLDVEQRQIKIQEAANERAERASHVDEDVALINAVTAMTVTGRNQLYDMIESGQMSNGAGGMLPARPVDPMMRGAAVTLGDVMPDYRESARAALARKMGVDVSNVPDSIILSEENQVMAGLISKENMALTFEAMMDPGNKGAFTAAAGEGIAANLSGETGRPLGQITTESMLADLTQNEFLRIDPTTGEVSGLLVSDPRQSRESAFASIGLPAPRNEYDINGQRVFLTSQVWDEIYKAQITSALQKDEDAARISAQTAADIAEKHGLPLVVAQSLVTGDLQNLPEAWRQVANDVQNTNLAVIKTLSQFAPFMAIEHASAIANGMKLDPEDVAPAIESILEIAAKRHPSMVIPRNLGFWKRALSILPGGTPWGIGTQVAPGFSNTNEAIGYGQGLPPAFELGGGVTSQDAMNAMPVFAQQMVELLSGLPPAQQALELADMAKTGMITSGNGFIAIDPATINTIREELRRRQSTVPPQ